MGFNWKEGLKGALMTPEQYSRDQDRKAESKRTAENREYEIMKMLYADKLAQERAMKSAEAQHGFKMKEIDYRQLADSKKNSGGFSAPEDIPAIGPSGIPLEGYHMNPSGKYLPKYRHPSLQQESGESYSKFMKTARPVPTWVPQGKESSYQKAKEFYSDDEIKQFLRG